MTTDQQRSPRIGLGWVVRFRWVALSFVALAFGTTAGLGIRVPWVPVTLCLALIATSNVVLQRVAPRFEREATGAVMIVDPLILTVFLGLTGGASNPFSVIYLVYVTLSAVLLGSRWTWTIVLFTCACFASLFVWPTRAAVADTAMNHPHHSGMGGFDFHLYGMLLAFIVAAVLIGYLVTLVAKTLRENEAALQLARDRAARSERVASLTSLAAGAAHELGSPLGTIAVAASELARRAQDLPASADPIQKDARLIGSEVRRCRAILDRMAERAGALTGEPRAAVDVRGLVEALRADLPDTQESRLEIRVDESLGTLSVPPRALRQVLVNLVQNAFDASDSDESVRLDIRSADRGVGFVVRDEGAGMTSELIDRAGEPFLTTKGAGRGLGLGLFLAQTLAERLGGELRFESALGCGTTATLELPIGSSES